MELQKAILKYEKKNLKEFYKTLVKKVPHFKYLDASSYLKSDFAKTEAIVDTAYKLGDKHLTDDTLDEVIEKFEKSDVVGAKQLLNDEVKSKRREWAKAKIEFYQQLFSQEGKADSFEKAVKQQFGGAQHYRYALKIIADVEKSYNEVLYETNSSLKMTAWLEKTLNEVADECRENSVKRIF